MQLTEKTIQSLKTELQSSLLKFSEGKLTEEIVTKISDKVFKKIDLNNPVLGHKGMNWLAKEILKDIKLP